MKEDSEWEWKLAVALAKALGTWHDFSHHKECQQCQLMRSQAQAVCDEYAQKRGYEPPREEKAPCDR